MQANEYFFHTHWLVEGTVKEVADILGDAEGLKRWWPSVYLDVREVRPGDDRGLGKEVELYTKGWLPYTLRWRFRVTESNYPHGFTLEALGDFVGTGVWRLTQEGDWVNVEYDWRIRAEKPLLRLLSPLLRPLFAFNHRWAMERGEESLRLELRRLHAKTPEERAAIPPPPKATPATPTAPLAIGVAGAAALVLYTLRRGGR
jgi:hypothetical protein